MIALRKTKEGVGHVELCEVPIPEIGPSEVLMKVWAAGICGRVAADGALIHPGRIRREK